jgi:hypothetical protein
MFSAMLSLREKAWSSPSPSEEQRPQFASFVQSTWCESLTRDGKIAMEKAKEEKELADLEGLDLFYYSAAHAKVI